jgi:ABC-type multidrug transport system ATPase subunit
VKIHLLEIGKRFKKNWIFRDLSFEFSSGKTYAITGHNGSGKSTLLKSIAGFEHLTKGEISYEADNQKIDKNNISHFYSYCAPYQDLIKEMTLAEFLDFHQTMTEKFDYNEMLKAVGLTGNEQKLLGDFSSGMTQRLKLGICFYSGRPLLLLDEPTSNLDLKGKEIFKILIDKHRNTKTILIASNESDEISLCDKVLNIEKYI